MEQGVFKIWSKIDNFVLRQRKTETAQKITEKNDKPDGDFNNKPSNNKPRQFLPEKQFKERRSLLIELFEDNVHIQSVYNIIISFFLIFVFTHLLKEYSIYGRVPLGFILIYEKFGKLHLTLLLWLMNNFATFLMFTAFCLWAKIRQTVFRRDNALKWDIICVTILCTYYLSSFVVITKVVNQFNIPFASSMILCADSVRMLMKLHAFIRSNAGKVIKSNTTKHNIPSFFKFLYFLYIPTAVYKDEYPRTQSIRWKFIFARAIEVLGVIVLYAFCFEYISKTVFKDACIKKLTLMDYVIMLFEFSIPCVLILWGLFFVLLHSSQNLVGELLQFGDRLFYTDWWTSTDLQQYYRKWNLVVGDWLYTYVHKDICDFFTPTPKVRDAGKIITILLSAVVHEWICTVTTGYFFPVTFVSMMGSLLLCIGVKAEKNSGFVNFIALFIMILGSSFVGTSYGLEYYARKNLNITDYFGSVFVTYNCINF